MGLSHASKRLRSLPSGAGNDEWRRRSEHMNPANTKRDSGSQAPIGSGFGAASTAAQVIAGLDLTGKTAVVTGGYSGIGVETVRALRSAGVKVIVPARDVPKAKAALREMPDVVVDEMDLLAPATIDAFAGRVLGS